MIQKLKSALSVVRDERGLTTVEYIIVLGLIAVVGIQAWRTFGSTLSSEVTTATSRVNVVTSPGGAAGGTP